MNTFEQWAPLIRHIAGKRFNQSGCDFDDLLQEGAIALLYALKHFDKDRASFKTYAYVCIHNAMSQFALKEARHSTRHRTRHWTQHGIDPLDCEGVEQMIDADHNNACMERLRQVIPQAGIDLMLVRADGATLEELGKVLDCSGENVRVKLNGLYQEAKEVLAA